MTWAPPHLPEVATRARVIGWELVETMNRSVAEIDAWLHSKRTAEHSLEADRLAQYAGDVAGFARETAMRAVRPWTIRDSVTSRDALRALGVTA